MALPVTRLNNPETYTERGDAVRARGNVLYGEVVAGGGGNAAGKRNKLQRAQQLYDEALELSCNSEKRASCCKNLGALHYLWGRVELEQVPCWSDVGGARIFGAVPAEVPKALSPCTQHLSQAVNFFVRAHVEGARAQKSQEWMQHVAKSVAGVVAWAAEQSRILEFPGAPILQSLCKDLEKLGRNNLAFKVEAEALANLELAECLVQLDMPYDSQEHLNKASHLLDNASHLLDSLPPSSTKDDLRKRISRLRGQPRFISSSFSNLFHIN